MAGLGVALCCMVALEYYAVEGRFRASQCQAGCPLSPPCMADCWFFCFVLFCFVFFSYFCQQVREQTKLQEEISV